MTTSGKGTVLIAVDGSRNSIAAAGVGARMAQLLGMHVGLLHVLNVPVFFSFWVGVEARLKDDVRAQAEATLTEISERIRRTCNVLPEFYIVDGDPVEEIEKLVRADPSIVMVVTGREGMGSERRSELVRDRAGDHLGAKLADRLSVPVLLVPREAPKSMICEALNELVRQSGAAA
jgi:nucleotide-binding universal stress UspA family protein